MNAQSRHPFEAAAPSLDPGAVAVAEPGERRKASRRAARTRRDRPSTAAGSGTLPSAELISREWFIVAPVMAVCMVLIGFGSGSTPPLPSVIAALGAMAIVAGSRLLFLSEKALGRSFLHRFLMMEAVVALPQAMFGFAVSHWAHTAPTVGWVEAVGVIAIVTTAAAVVLNGRLPAMLASIISLWLLVVALNSSLTAWLLLIAGVASCLVAAIRQQRIERAELLRSQEIERRQVRAEEILSDYEQTGQGWFWETDRRGMLTYISPTLGKILGRDTALVVGRPLGELFVLDPQGRDSERTLNFHLSARSSFADVAVRANNPQEERWWSITGRPIHDSHGNFLGFRGSGSDLTEKRLSQARATRLAHYDSLTGLPNRFQMSQTLDKILGAVRTEDRQCAVFLLDLDRFKQVNDTMGHPVGDALLQQVGQRLQSTVGDSGRVGRLGGDEFKVVLPGRTGRTELAELAKQIIEQVSQPYSIDGCHCVIGASIGIAVSPGDGVTSEALIRNADLALYAAKDAGRGQHHFFAPNLHSHAEERRQLEQDLRDAIVQGGLELYYQPVVETATERITGFEALLRWNHPVHGQLSPARFIPIAEEAGLIAPIGEWALRTACHDLARWPETVRVAVNVSSLQFANPALPSIVTNALAAAQASPSRLELEITESVFLSDDAGTDAMFAALKRVGVRLALDDFGTGYSSIAYLRNAPFDKIKIDQAFVRGATVKGSRNAAIIASIVSLAEALGMETTAEGVETLDELDIVRLLGCSHIQGHIYERPLDAEAATQRLGAGLFAIAKGPRSARANRQRILRKVTLDHNGEKYGATIRNLSQTGALIEGLWNVPAGTVFNFRLVGGEQVMAMTRWSQDDRMGVEFSAPLETDIGGRIRIPASSRQAISPPVLLAGGAR